MRESRIPVSTYRLQFSRELRCQRRGNRRDQAGQTPRQRPSRIAFKSGARSVTKKAWGPLLQMLPAINKLYGELTKELHGK
jgi:hypothetical protein